MSRRRINGAARGRDAGPDPDDWGQDWQRVAWDLGAWDWDTGGDEIDDLAYAFPEHEWARGP